MSNSHDTEFGEFVFSNDLTTFEALSQLDVTHLGRDVQNLRRELDQTRSELSDQAVMLDNLTARVNTLNFQVNDHTAEISLLEAGLQTVSINLGQTNTELSVVRNTANAAQTAANTAVSTAQAAQTTASAAQTAASTATSTAQAAQTTANAAQTTANIANNTANTSLGIAQRSQQYLNGTPVVSSLGSVIHCYEQNQNWRVVTLVGTLGSAVMTETGYSGQIVTTNTAGSTATSSWNFIRFSAPGNFASRTPIRLRSGSWRLQFGTSATSTTTITVLVQDYANTAI